MCDVRVAKRSGMLQINVLMIGRSEFVNFVERSMSLRRYVKGHSVFDVMEWDISEINAQQKSSQLVLNVVQSVILGQNA